MELFRLAAGERRIELVVTLTEPAGQPDIGAPPGYFHALLGLRTEGEVVSGHELAYGAGPLVRLADELAHLPHGRSGAAIVGGGTQEVTFLRGDAAPVKEPARVSFWTRWQHPTDEADAAALGPDDVVVTITHGENAGSPRVTFFLDDGIAALGAAGTALSDQLARSAWAQEHLSIHGEL